jgi:hypothetical protein
MIAIATTSPPNTAGRSVMGGSQVKRVRLARKRQVPPLLGREFGKLLLGGCQQTPEPDDDKVAQQEGVNVLGASAPPFLLKATDPVADGGFDLALRFHRGGDAETDARICSTFPKSPGLTKW